MRTLILLVAGILSACGVKAPPVAPEQKIAVEAPVLDCSSQDPKCDVKDPNYKRRSR